MHSPAVRSLALALLLIGTSRPVHAVQAPGHDDLAVDLLASEAPPERPSPEVQHALSRTPAWRAWAAAHPGWRVQWNAATRTPHRAWGPGLRLPLAGALAADNIERACRAFLQETAAVTGIRDASLRLAKAERRRGRWYVAFEQTADGIPVRGGRADLRLGPDGEVVLWGADWYPDVAFLPPTVGETAARAAACSDLAAPRDVLHGLVVVPVPEAAVPEYRLAHEVRFRTDEPPGDWYALVDARTGQLLLRQNRIRWAQLTGRITAAVEPSTTGDPQVELPLADTRFNVGSGTTEFGYTDAGGDFDVTTAATDSVNVWTRLHARWARVYNHQLGLLTPRIDTRMLPGTRRDFLWNDSNSRASERDAFYHTLLAHRYVKDLDPGFTGVDYPMPVKVDIYDRDCNAYWDGIGINFFGESGRCTNTARIADVVYHEYGHGITDMQYRPFAPSGAMHEGFSDYYAATITDQPLIGRGFRGPGTIIRSIDNTRRFPEDWVGEVHIDGLIVAGALWDLREALGRALADTLFHYARYGAADNFDDYLLDVLVTDDDNADIYDGTPHFDAIIAAFASHGIGDYSVQIAHDERPDTEDPNQVLRIEATILSIFVLDPASVQLHYALDGGAWVSLSMTPTGAAVRQFAATIPSQPLGTDVAYFIAAADSAGHAAVLPPGAPAEPFRFRVGIDATPPVIVHDRLPDRPIAASAWPLAAVVTDNLDRGLASVLLRYGRSASVDSQLVLVEEPAARWRGRLPLAGVSLGDSVYYRIVATDSAATPNVALSPPSGVHAFRVVQGSLEEFDTDAGYTGDGDWEWGTPTAGAAGTAALNTLWATNLQGAYTNDTESILEPAAVDLGTWSRASLVFQHLYETEEFYDGGRVEVSTDGGANWELLVPNGGYPWNHVLALDGPGYSDDSFGWQTAEFDLSRYVGQTIRLRWRFVSDSGVTGPGWSVDDVEIVERQVLSVPLGAAAASGFDSRVPVTWQPPAGIDPLQAGTPLLGYHVYRATRSDLAGAVRLTASPLAVASFTDATAVNGVVSYYAVTALYAEGESRLSVPSAGQAYVAGYSTDTSQLDVLVTNGAAFDTTITFTNTGTGFLNCNLWVGDAADALDSVRVAYSLQNPLASSHPAKASPAPARERWLRRDLLRSLAERPLRRPRAAAPIVDRTPTRGGFTLLFTDGSEGTTPDLKEFSVMETGGEIRFEITGYQPWGNLLTDFNVIIGIDADADRGTGDEEGYDYYVLMGVYPLNVIGSPAAIVTPNRQVVGIPSHQVFPIGGDFLEVGFPVAILGGTARLYLNAFALDASLQVPIDFLPDPAAALAWLQPASGWISAAAGSPASLGLSFPGLVPPGNYAGTLWLETNDPSLPAASVPVGYDFRTTPVEIYDLTVVQDRSDVVLRWRTGAETDVAGYRVFRAASGGAFEALSPDVPLVAARSYAFRDADPQVGRYAYRVGEVALDGSVALHGAVEIAVVRALPARTFLDPAVPNPFNPSTTLHYGVAQDGRAALRVYDARGRLVRTLVDTPRHAAGYARAVWDGRDDRGRRVASGVYHARLEVQGAVTTRRLTLVK